jgi:hypothetical protein
MLVYGYEWKRRMEAIRGELGGTQGDFAGEGIPEH